MNDMVPPALPQCGCVGTPFYQLLECGGYVDLLCSLVYLMMSSLESHCQSSDLCNLVLSCLGRAVAHSMRAYAPHRMIRIPIAVGTTIHGMKDFSTTTIVGTFEKYSEYSRWMWVVTSIAWGP